MGRPGYMSLYADERTQQIFDEYVRIQGVKKSEALAELLEIYMMCQEVTLYWKLKKTSVGVEVAKEVLIQREYDREVNDYIFLKLATTYDVEGKPMNGYETVEAQICPGEKNEKLHVL